MAIVQKHGKPDLFITWTFDVNCVEMKDILKNSNTKSPYDRAEMIARLFNIKNNEVHNDIITKGIFGEVKAYLSVVEFQKRGAPHSHILIWLKDFKATSYTIDNMISAEVPPPNSRLYELVTKYMVHRCGASCLRDDQCKKHYPKDFSDTTDVGDDAFPIYRRRSPKEGGRQFIQHYYKKPMIKDNRDIVPYSPYLLDKYGSHVNVEYCATIKAIKYIVFYPLKGKDMITIEVGDKEDEIGRFLSKRYISSCDGTYSIYEFPRVRLKPPVMQLTLHLPEKQHTKYEPNEESAKAALESKQQRTPLIA